MNELKTHLSARMVDALVSLRAAEAAGDDYLVGVREGELDSLTRLAEAHCIDAAELEADVEAAVAAAAATTATTIDLRTELTQREPA